MLPFSSILEEEVHLASQPSLDECPECADVMIDKNGEKTCAGCAHRQPIITQQVATAGLRFTTEIRPTFHREAKRFVSALIIRAFMGGEPVGYLAAEPHGTQYVTDYIEVHPDYRRQGIALKLLAEAHAEVPLVPYVQMQDQVYKSPAGRQLALKFYGFTEDLRTSKVKTAGPAMLALGEMGGAAAAGGEAAGLAGGATGGLELGQVGQLMSKAMSGQQQGQVNSPAIDPGAAGALGAPGNSMSVAPVGVIGRKTAMPDMRSVPEQYDIDQAALQLESIGFHMLDTDRSVIYFRNDEGVELQLQIPEAYDEMGGTSGHGPEHFNAQNADFQAPEDYDR